MGSKKKVTKPVQPVLQRMYVLSKDGIQHPQTMADSVNACWLTAREMICQLEGRTFTAVYGSANTVTRSLQNELSRRGWLFHEMLVGSEAWRQLMMQPQPVTPALAQRLANLALTPKFTNMGAAPRKAAAAYKFQKAGTRTPEHGDIYDYGNGTVVWVDEVNGVTCTVENNLNERFAIPTARLGTTYPLIQTADGAIQASNSAVHTYLMNNCEVYANAINDASNLRRRVMETEAQRDMANNTCRQFQAQNGALQLQVQQLNEQLRHANQMLAGIRQQMGRPTPW